MPVTINDAMGGEDDVVARSARLAPGPDVAASIPEALSRDRVYECGGGSLGPLGPPPPVSRRPCTIVGQ